MKCCNGLSIGLRRRDSKTQECLTHTNRFFNRESQSENQGEDRSVTIVICSISKLHRE